MIIAETNGREDIFFLPHGVEDGIKIGLLKSKLDKYNFRYTLEENRLTMSQKDLMEFLTLDVQKGN